MLQPLESRPASCPIGARIRLPSHYRRPADAGISRDYEIGSIRILHTCPWFYGEGQSRYARVEAGFEWPGGVRSDAAVARRQSSRLLSGRVEVRVLPVAVGHCRKGEG